VLAAHEAGGANAVVVRSACGNSSSGRRSRRGDHDEGPKARAAGLALPGAEIETLVGRESCAWSSRPQINGLAEPPTISTRAMRLAFDRVASAVRLSVATAMVITKPVYRGLF
jgi:hypothetical protein